jgi:hypothetical protein
VGGRFEAVLDNLRGVAEVRRRLGKERPILVWRYILFDWNDSNEEMELARRMSKEAGADYLAWHLNVADSSMSSRRFYIGSPALSAISGELWDNLQFAFPLDYGHDAYTKAPPAPMPSLLPRA